MRLNMRQLLQPSRSILRSASLLHLRLILLILRELLLLGFLLQRHSHIRYQESRISIIAITLPLALSVLASRPTVDSSFILQIGHNAVLFQIVNVECF